MRKGMLFFSQYRTLRRIFLKNLKKYLRFVGPYRPGAFFLQDGVLRPTVWPLLCSDECGPGSGGIGSVGPGGPVPPQIPAGRYVRPMRRNTIEKIVEEMMTTTKSERTTRVIDFDQDASMEQKKREGYF